MPLFSSYHCSRYNTNTRVLTPDMFRSVFAEVRAYLDRTPATVQSATG
jgi:uracil-DNA glycosylase